MAEAAKKEDLENEGEEGAEVAPGKKKKLFLLIGIGLFLAAGIGGGLFFFLSGGDKEDGSHEVAADEHGEKAAEGGHGEEAKTEGHGEKAAEGGHGEKPAEGGHGEQAAEGGHGEKPAADQKPATLPDFGETFALKSFNLNLGNPLENRYVRLEVTIEFVGGSEQKKELEARTPQLRDAVISVVTRKTREFLLAPDGKEQLRKEILTRINRYMTKPVKSIYITDLLIE
jgi:flagellar FliL protein